MCIRDRNRCAIRDVWFRRAKNEEHTYFIAKVSADTELVFCEKDKPGYDIKWLDVDALSDEKIIVTEDMRKYFINSVIPFIKS